MLPEFITEEILFRGGLNIYTTIDLAFQEAATASLQQGLTDLEKSPGFKKTTRSQYLAGNPNFSNQPPYVQGAFVAISNVDGGILSVVGGRHYDESTFNRALSARRQIGSTVKPFVYSYAFNVLNATAFTEVDRSEFALTLAQPGMPHAGNKPDFIPIRTALETSNNYATMRVGLASGVEGFSYFMSELTGTKIEPYPSTFLGACALTPIELASAFSIFPNYGVALDPYLIKSVTMHDGRLLFERIDERKRVLSPQVAYQIQDLLAGVVNRGTGRALRQTFGFEKGLGGKTGTTNDYKDAWFAGYTSEVTAVVWVGFDQPQPIMPAGYASRIAVPIWGSIMKQANQHYAAKEFFPPQGVEKVQRKKENKILWIFKSESVAGPSEYVRDEQRGNALARLDNDFEPTLLEQNEKSVVRRAWEWAFPSSPGDDFKATGEEITRAEIHDTIETKAPRAEPVE
jgi:penicillin-binding protein 1A